MRRTASSSERTWFGFEAAIIETTGGYLERAATPEQHISMHIGPPVKARCRFDGSSKRYLQSRGDIIVVPAGCPAVWEDDGGTSIVSVDIKPALVHLVAEDLAIDVGIFSLDAHMQLRDARIEHILWALTAELQSSDAADDLYADSLGIALTAQLLKRCTINPVSQSSKISKRQVQRAIDYIRENLDGNLSLLQIARAAGVGVSHLKTQFKECTGLAVHQFVVQRRVEMALGLLQIGGLSIAEVAAQAGFSDQSHLSRCMRRVLGVSPGMIAGRKRKHVFPLYRC